MIEDKISRWQKRILGEYKKDTGPRSGLEDRDPVREVNYDKNGTADKIPMNSMPVNTSLRKKLSGVCAVQAQTKKVQPKARPSQKALHYIDIWNSSQFTKLKPYKSKSCEKRDIKTKQYINTIKYLRIFIRGDLYSGKHTAVKFPSDFQPKIMHISPELFRRYVSNLETMAFDNNYLPCNKAYLQKMNLLKFLIGGGEYGAATSALLQYAIKPPVLNTPARSKNPVLTDAFKVSYLRYSGRIEKSLTFKERNDLVMASNKLLKFFEEFYSAFRSCGYSHPKKFLEDHYWASLNGKTIAPLFYLNSEEFLVRRLIPLCINRGIISKTDFMQWEKSNNL